MYIKEEREAVLLWAGKGKGAPLIHLPIGLKEYQSRNAIKPKLHLLKTFRSVSFFCFHSEWHNTVLSRWPPSRHAGWVPFLLPTTSRGHGTAQGGHASYEDALTA